MSVEYITKVIKIDVTPSQKLILFVLANYSDEHGRSYPSHKKLSEITCLSLTAIKDNLQKLKTMGLVDWERKNNTSNTYTLQVEPLGGYQTPPGGYNTKEYTKAIYILDLDKINEIYKKVCTSPYYKKSANTFTAERRWKDLRDLGRKGIVSPKTGKKIDLASDEFWKKYFDIANSEGHINHLRGFMKGKPDLRTLLSPNQFNSIIERKYG
jgi:Fe2+ or Zn2+ uptake regulation protein|tara:strand:- start:1766 stop:2398 length:633 start_codon:yes stop_codon:yes gene_type:complete